MRFGIVGDPVDHSRSPAMHTAGYRHLGVDAVYDFLPTPAGEFDRVVSDLRMGKLDGVNVTMPHKRHAFEAANELDTTARRVGAANTLVMRDMVIHGYNTDVAGVRFAYEYLGVDSGLAVFVLGSGGAAAAALVAFDGTSQITIASRTQGNAAALAQRTGVDASVVSWGDVVGGAVVVNATPLGMHREMLPEGVIEASAGLVDMPYGGATTPAIETASLRSIPAADGLVMLAGQAKEAFHLFTGRDVPMSILEAAARAS